MTSSMLARVVETIDAYFCLGNDVEVRDHATFIRNDACPCRWDSNHARRVTAESDDEIEQFLHALRASYPSRLKVDVSPLTSPGLVARLVAEGFAADTTLQMVLEGKLRATPKPYDLREVLTGDDWRAFERLQALDWRETCERIGRPYDSDALPDFTRSKRVKTPPLRYWLALDEGGEPRAYFSSWQGANGMGLVEDLFTEREHRHRGYATALLAHAVADARARGAGPVIIGADANDTPKHMYVAMGWKPVTLTWSMGRDA